MVIPFGFSLKSGPERIKPGSEEESEFLGLVSDHVFFLSISSNDGEIPTVVFCVVDTVASVWSLVTKASRVYMHLKFW